MTPAWSWPGWFPSGALSWHQRRILARGGELRDDLPCAECGLPHTPERRLAILRRCEGMTAVEIADAYPHIWPDACDRESAGHRMLMRDRAALRGGR